MTTLALALFLAAAPADTLGACLGAQTLTRADLEAAGVGRLADLARALEDLEAVSVDGFDADLGATGPAVGLAPLRVLVDGQTLLASSTVEPAGLEMLPVAVGEIESVTYCPEPTIAEGALRSATLHIRTSPPARLYLAVDVGNEVGDPGPRRYLEPDRPNVDHEGPDAEAIAAVTAERSAAWALVRRRQLFPTDTAIVDRVRAGLAPDRFPARSGWAAGARVQTRRAGGHALRVGALRFDDLPYVLGIGRELPVERQTVQAVASGGPPRPIGPVRIGYRAGASHLSLARPAWSRLADPDRVGPDWQETRAHAAVELAGRTLGRSLRGGLQGEVLRASGPGLRDGTVPLGRAWAESERRRGGNRQSVRVALATTGGELAASGAFVSAVVVGGAELGLVLSGVRQLAAERPDLAFWTARGYAGLDLDGVTHVRGQAQNGSEDRARASLSGRVSGVRVGGWVDARRVRADLVLYDIGAGSSPRAASRLVTAAGDEVRGGVWAERRRRAGVLRAYVRVGGAVRGSAAFREVARRQPVARAGVRASAAPTAGLRLGARLEGRTASSWAGFPDPRVPGHVVLDVSLDKTVWDRRGRVSLLGRNVLGAPERTHPAGATFAPRLHLRLEVRL